ncbi:hypothetical protein PR202_ga07928 [Eleusine coracana subsp. coracana]|uniref:Mitochondrial carnitine/acylcarnitine carrier-like protein n=1 Tax=Eleusine coracana subsp. coracana TaxID=191504 RepID=A0AAV5C1E6_ELECO|nr:hypothetical protein PR202_ga07928 [Eleusine coracana subsp. coracana]
MGDVAKDLTAGTVGGAANIIVGHPFDTIKVKLQSQPTPAPGQVAKYSGAIDAVKQTIAAEGPRGLYKGMGAPLATVAALNAVLFSVRGQMEAVLRTEPGAPLTVKQQVIAGAGAGIAVSFLACPTELIKCRLQAQSSLAEAAAASGIALPKGPIDVAKHVVHDAGARGLFKGLVPTLGREVPGNAVMFGVYEAAKQFLAGGKDTSNLGRGSQILAGGLAGAAFWLSVYPTDVVKSVIQVDDYKNPRYSGSINALRKIVAAEGVKGLYKGFGPAMARSVPANAATFVNQMGDVAKDLTAGTMGGVANLFVGHPFDTIKVKLQSQPTPAPGQLPKYSGAIDAVKQTVAAEGPRGLYKGMGAPLATVAAFNAVLFSARGQMEALLRSEPGVPLTVKQQVVAGAGAGVVVSFLACPTELIKCRLQAQSSLAEAAAASGVAVPKGPIDVAKHVVRDAGARGLFKGLVPTLGREVPGNAVIFGVYEAVKQYLAGGTDTSSLSRGSQIMAGGLAGAAFWLTVYPTDVVKSVIQVDDFKNPRYSGSMDAFRKIVAADGVKGLYKGFGPAMARSVPANAATFVAYEITRSSLG